MGALVSLAGTSATAFAQDDVEIIAADARTPLPTVVITPGAGSTDISTSELIRIVAASIEKRSRFGVDAIEAAELAECEGQLRCILERTRTRIARETPFFLLLSVLARSQGPDRLSLFLVDLEKVSRITSEADAMSGKDATDQIDRRIDEEAVALRAGPVEFGDVESARKVFDGLGDRDLGPLLASSPAGQPFGGVEVESPIAGVAVELDGRPIAKIRGRRARIIDLKPGRRELRFIAPDRSESRTIVDVKSTVEARVTPILDPVEDDSTLLVRKGVFWGGIGVAAVGAVILTYAIASSDRVSTVCIGAEGADVSGCSRPAFTSTSRDPDQAPTFTDAVDSGGVLIAPLGYSLMATGATWSLGTAFFGSERDMPIIELAAGVALGAISYGVSHLLGADRSFD